MSKRIPLIDFNRSYTFSNYFDLPYETEDIVGEFGYSFKRAHLNLPLSDRTLERHASLKERIEESLPYISRQSEIARREFLIAPLLMDVVHYTHVKLVSEYSLVVTEQLKGSFDYYLYEQNQVLIVEAKKADLDRGFTQLAVELIALEQWTDSDNQILTGAVSTGSIWQFGQLNRNSKVITQDLNLYTVPANLEELQRILVKILSC